MQKKRKMRYLSSVLITAAVLLWALMAPHTAKAANVSLNSTNFPDEAFRTAVKSAFDANNDNTLSATEISRAKKLDASSSEIADVAGLQYLTALQELNVQDNYLETLDVSSNTALTTLICNSNDLSGLDVSMLSNLTFLDCSENSIEELDLTNNTKLERLEVYDNNLATINVSKNVLLTYLDLHENSRLKTIGENNSNTVSVTKNTLLTYFDCSNTSLPMIDVSKCLNLEELYADEANLTTLNVGSNTKLVVLHASYNDLTMVDLSKNPLLEELSICCNSRMQYLDLSKQTKLIYLDITCNGVKDLDVSVCADLEVLYAGGGPLETLTLLSHPKLAEFNVSDCYVNRIDISGCPLLIKAYNNPSTPGVVFIYDEGATIITEGAPTITTQPKSVTAAAGDSVKFTVKASGSNLTYQWYYKKPSESTWNISSAASAKTATYSVTAKDTYNGYSYRCVVSNSYGKATSQTATLTVTSASKPVITSQPSNASVSIGNTVKYTVTATGSNLTYQWYYRTDSSDSWKISSASGNKTNTLSFTAKESYSGRQYKCAVKNSSGTTNSNIVSLTVVPKITAQPKNLSVSLGSSAVLTVTAEGTDLTYQWYFRKSSSESWSKSSASGSTTSKCTFTAKEAYSGREYRCKVTSKYGSIYTKTVTLTVLPKIVTQPKAVKASIGNTAKFTVTAEGTDLTYQWYYRKTSADSWSKSTATGSTTNTCKFTAKEAYSGREYRCKITSSYGSIYTDTVTLTVVAKITSQPKDITVAEGKTAKFTVAAEGTDLTYQWYYRYSSSDSWIKSTSASGTTASYSFTGKASYSGRQCRCKVTSKYGYIYTTAATLTVQ